MFFEKSNAQSFYEEIAIENGFFILKFNNDTYDNQSFTREVGTKFIQFHFCIKGSASFTFNEGNYVLSLHEGTSLLLYNPEADLPLNLEVKGNSWVLSVLLPIEMFHGLFSNEANFISFLSEANKGKKYYKEAIISPSMAIAINQLINFNLHPSVRALYFKAKAYEILSLYFNRPADIDVEQCPFLTDEENVDKIKKAKQIIIERMSEPPTLQELSDEINLPLNRLKEGFKQIYGDSVYSFLFDYKMEVARQLLATGSHNVNEVGLKVGYSTSSHFITSFKKKFGTTPKKYLMGLSN
jgi:AraC-like DNA-binding protein